MYIFIYLVIIRLTFVVFWFFFLRIRRPPRSTLDRSSAASDVYKRQVMAVLVILAVGLIMFFVVGHKILQAESVMRCDEVDAGKRASPAHLVEIAAAGKPICQLGNLPSVSLPIPADRITVLSVPFSPADREITDLVSACLLYTSDAADERSSVDLGGRRII